MMTTRMIMVISIGGSETISIVSQGNENDAMLIRPLFFVCMMLPIVTATCHGIRDPTYPFLFFLFRI